MQGLVQVLAEGLALCTCQVLYYGTPAEEGNDAHFLSEKLIEPLIEAQYP